MTFEPIRLRPESGANLIKDASEAHAFMMHMNMALQNKPHWQVARQASVRSIAGYRVESLARVSRCREARRMARGLDHPPAPHPIDKTIWTRLKR
jgi:hypothetical protein